MAFVEKGMLKDMAFMKDLLGEPGEGTMEWGITKIPQFTGKKAYVLGGAFYAEVVMLMAEAGFERADSVKEADVVVFTGGSDVDPILYGQKALEGTSFSAERDTREALIYSECKRLKKAMFGICRGMQFLAVMNNCELWQHVENHGGRSHWIYDIDDDYRVMATSIHHQQVMASDNMDIIAVCEDQVSRVFMNADLHIDLNREGANAPHELEIEACAFHKTYCFCVQGHPEVGTPEYKSWCMSTLKSLMVTWGMDEIEEKTEPEEINLEERVVG